MSRFIKAQPITTNNISSETKFKITNQIISLKGDTKYWSIIQACHDAIEAVYSNNTLESIISKLDIYRTNADKVKDESMWRAFAENYLATMDIIKQIINEEIKEV